MDKQKPKRPRGRPRKLRSEVRSEWIGVPVTLAEKAELQARADADESAKGKLSSLIRLALGYDADR